MQYTAAKKMVNYLTLEYSSTPNKEILRETVDLQTQHFLQLEIGKCIVFALSKRKAEHWTEENVLDALKAETLSVVADNWITHIPKIKQTLSSMLKKVQVTSA